MKSNLTIHLLRELFIFKHEFVFPVHVEYFIQLQKAQHKQLFVRIPHNEGVDEEILGFFQYSEVEQFVFNLRREFQPLIHLWAQV